jgi:UDP-glucose 4-epimerase
MSKTILVTGSSGFIGSVLVQDLLEKHYTVIGVDLIPSHILHKNFTPYILDLTKKDSLNVLNFFTKDIYSVCHLAAKIRVDESMIDPGLYYEHNITATNNLLIWCKKNNILNILFASTAAVYGTPLDNCIKGYIENQSGDPVSVYGKTKLICENLIKDFHIAHNFRGYIFRFFNVCGGSEFNHGKPLHLIPIIVNNIIQGKDIQIFGNNYNTKDGTCVRDYIHLKDISNGFILAIEKGFEINDIKIYNLGSEEGFTVKEIIDKCLEIFNKIHPNFIYNTKIINSNRRLGDFDTLIADNSLCKKELNWTTKYNLDDMITDTIKSFNY